MPTKHHIKHILQIANTGTTIEEMSMKKDSEKKKNVSSSKTKEVLNQVKHGQYVTLHSNRSGVTGRSETLYQATVTCALLHRVVVRALLSGLGICQGGHQQQGSEGITSPMFHFYNTGIYESLDSGF